MSRLAPLALLLYLLAAGHPESLVGALPWGPLALGAATALGCGVVAAWPLAPHRCLRGLTIATFLLVGLKLALALTAPRYGLQANYYANEGFDNAPERSTVAPGTGYTRLDTRLEFGGDEFPLFFFNDLKRFNSSGSDRLDRDQALTWSARWTGYLNASGDGPFTIWLTASGPASLSLDRKPLLQVDADGRATAQAQVELTAGPHPLQLRYVRKKERSAYLKVESDQFGVRGPLMAPLLTPERYPPERLALDQTMVQLARTLDIVFLGLFAAWLIVAVAARWRQARAAGLRRLVVLEQPLLALVPFGFYLQAALPRLDRFGKMLFLGGGQDWLTHETLAREIQLNGPLMTLGEPLGQGALYYAQPFYPYYLALLHTLSGEDFYGPIALQMVGLGAAVVVLYFLTRELFGRRAALVNLALLLLVMVPFELAWVARLLISEAPYFWVMPAAVLALVLLARTPSPGLGAIAGGLLGLACITRGPTLLYLPAALLLLAATWRQAGLPRATTTRPLLLLAVCAVAVIGLVPLRNVIVAGKPALTASSGGVNLEKLHRPSATVRLASARSEPLYQALNLDQPTREVLEYLRQDPAGYFGSYLPLAAYTLGVGSALNDLLDERPVQLRPELLLLDLLYVLALLLISAARTTRACLLHAFIGLHFLTMVVFAPYDYENRLVTPMYLFVGVFGAAALAYLGERTAGLIRLIRQPTHGPSTHPAQVTQRIVAE
jgi:Dolichyl-phosphate-mannose-protein mannosyltransferase/PA14 domain